MAEKLPTTPDGMVCKECGRDLPAYHFFNPRGKYNKHFFVRGVVPNVCFDCAGPYRCAGCNEIKPASEFRVQGRLCLDCRQEGLIYSEQGLSSAFDAAQASEAIEGANTLETAGDDD